MKKRFAASTMILAMSAATILLPLTAFADAEEQELNIAIFQGGYGDAYWNQMVELFEESHEGVKVNMTISPTIGDIIRPQIVAGNVPDFICLNDIISSGDGRQSFNSGFDFCWCKSKLIADSSSGKSVLYHVSTRKWNDAVKAFAGRKMNRTGRTAKSK